MQDLRVHARLAGQLAGIGLIALVVAVDNGPHFADMRHDHLVTEFS